MEALDLNAAEFSRRANLNGATVSRWFTAGVRPGIDAIRATAEALGVPIIEAMLAAEAITEEEVGVKIVAPDPDLLSDEEIARQVVKRLGRQHSAPQDEAEELVVKRDPTQVDLPTSLRGRAERRNSPRSVLS